MPPAAMAKPLALKQAAAGGLLLAASASLAAAACSNSCGSNSSSTTAESGAAAGASRCCGTPAATAAVAARAEEAVGSNSTLPREPSVVTSHRARGSRLQQQVMAAGAGSCADPRVCRHLWWAGVEWLEHPLTPPQPTTQRVPSARKPTAPQRGQQRVPQALLPRPARREVRRGDDIVGHRQQLLQACGVAMHGGAGSAGWPVSKSGEKQRSTLPGGSASAALYTQINDSTA